MKIKCPIPLCKSDREFVNSTSLFRHLMDDHTDHAVSSYLARKIFKIHERIAEYNKWKLEKFNGADVEAELKSLLENEK